MHISKLVHQRHKAAREKLKIILQRNASDISLTTDICIHNSISPFPFSRLEFILGCVDNWCFFRTPYWYRDISKIDRNSRIEEKVSCIVHDQASNMILSMDMLLDENLGVALIVYSYVLMQG